nr:phosphatidate cytidylyltransferase [uncultured Paludibaculum sp.]
MCLDFSINDPGITIDPASHLVRRHQLQANGMALIVTLTGFLGGLGMSAIKRDRGVKDCGQFIEGHGPAQTAGR